MAQAAGPETTALRAIVDKLIVSDPAKLDSWDVDFKPCIPIVKRHLLIWSPDATNRADRRARNKASSAHSSKHLALYVQDSKYETMAIRYGRPEPQALNKGVNAISNACANTFLSRTSVPFHHGEKSAYPTQLPNEKQVTARCKDVWVHLRETSGSANISILNNFKLHHAYFSAAPRVQLLVASGLADEAAAMQIMKKVYPISTFAVAGFHRGNPRIHPDLGSELHTMGDPADRLHLCALACRGAFSGLFTWNRVNSVLVQGGWPWLRGYSKAYARTIYTAMVIVFAAIECYTLEDMPAMQRRLLDLAGKLVGNPYGGPSHWRVRKTAYLTGDKVLVPEATSAALTATTTTTTTTTTSGAPSDAPIAAWSYAPTLPKLIDGPMPSHVAVGAACAHVNPADARARVNLAASVADLEQMTKENDGLTVALTGGDRRAHDEALAFVVQRRVLTVQRSEGQCVGCAVKLGHCIGALVVIG